MTGKGDNPRPLSVPATTYAANWFTTFGREIDDPSGYDPREKLCPPLGNEWPPRDTLPTIDPEAAE